MKKKKLILDILMTIVFLTLLNINLTDVAIHEWLGLGILVLFILHKVLNIKWITSVTKNFFSSKTKAKTRVGYIVDLLLFFIVAFIVLSGIFISQTILMEITVDNIFLWSTLHHLSAYSALALIGVHIGLHWQSIMNAFKKMLKLQPVNTARTIATRVIAIAIAALGVYGLTRPNVYTNFTAPFVAEDYLDNYNISSNQDITAVKTVSEYLANTQKPTSYAVNTAVLKEDSIANLAIQKTVTNYNQGIQTQTVSTVEDYLGNLFCTACGKHCSLLSPRCGRGQAQAQAAAAEYDASNASSEEATTPQNENSQEEYIPPTTESNVEKNSDTAITAPTENAQEIPSLNDYLGKLFCTACSRRCSLLSPNCTRGEQQAKAATEEYNSLYLSAVENQTEATQEKQGGNATEDNKEAVTEPATELQQQAEVENKELNYNLWEAISIMGLFVFVTHYICKIFTPKKRKNKPENYRYKQ